MTTALRLIGKGLKWVLIFVIALILLVLAGGNFYRIWGKSQLEPAGRMVSVGTHDMHIHCVGSGTPTVVLDIGQGGFSGNWAPVMQLAEPISRICAYDRSGMGWSEIGPTPYTAAGHIADLKSLLEAADEPGPYVLVGQSLGGALSWMFAQRYPEQTAGLITVDGAPPNVADVADAAGLSPDVPGFLIALENLGLRPLLFRMTAIPGDHIFLSEGILEELHATRGMGEEFRDMGSLGELPLIVMTHTEEFPIFGSEQAEPMWQQAQADLLTMSSNAKQVFVPAEHGYEPEQHPEMIAEAIEELVEEYRAVQDQS